MTRRCATCEEIDRLWDTGETLERLAERLGFSDPGYLVTHLGRHQRAHLVERIPRLLNVRPTTYR